MGKLYDLIVKQVNKTLEHKNKGINEMLVASDSENHTWIIIDSCATFRVLDPWIFDNEKLFAIFGQKGTFRGITNMLKDFNGAPVKYIGTRVENNNVLCEFIDVEKPLGLHGYMSKKHFELFQKLQKEMFCDGILEYDFEKCLFKWELAGEPIAIILGYRVTR